MQDVTERFKRSCAGLPDGRLVKMQGLGMLEAMNALQIGDPKMDTGVASSSNQQIYNPNISLSAEEVCWVIDHMTALEVAWYRGATLCQTVFTCIPCHKPELFAEQQGFVEQALRSYIYAYLKTIELAYAELSKGHVLDGEDVWLDHYGLPIEMFDDVDTILQEMDRGAHWALESNDPWMFELGKRFRVRAGIIRVLLAKSVDPPECDLTFTLNPGRAASLFDENMSRYLRQNMPLPTLSVPSHEEALNSIFEMFQDIRFAHVEELQELLWARHRRGPHLPLVRSVFKSTIMSKDSDWLFEEYIARQTGVIHVLHLMSEEIQDTERRQFTIWRDLVRGFYLNTCCVPLANPCRRRRIYLSLSSSWHERAVMAARFSGHNAPKVATALEALRLDCLLEAALGSWELELIAPSEEQCMWWWATCVAKQRAELQLKTSRQGEWACLWAEVGAAMQKLLSVSGPSSITSRDRFELRMKWPRKLPGLPDGKKVYDGLRPEYQDWLVARKTLQSRDGYELVREAKGHFRKAQTHIKQLKSWADDELSIATLDDLEMEITTIDCGGSQWDFATTGWLPGLR